MKYRRMKELSSGAEINQTCVTLTYQRKTQFLEECTTHVRVTVQHGEGGISIQRPRIDVLHFTSGVVDGGRDVVHAHAGETGEVAQESSQDESQKRPQVHLSFIAAQMNVELIAQTRQTLIHVTHHLSQGRERDCSLARLTPKPRSSGLYLSKYFVQGLQKELHKAALRVGIGRLLGELAPGTGFRHQSMASKQELSPSLTCGC